MVIAELIDSITDAPELFADIVTHDPISAIMVAFGGAFIALSIGFFAILVLGAVVDLVTPDKSSATHP